MAKKRRKRKSKRMTLTFRPEIAGGTLLVFTALTLVSLFAPTQGNLISAWADLLHWLFGGGGKYVVWGASGLLGVWFLQQYVRESPDEKWEKPLGVVLTVAMIQTVFYLIAPGASTTEPGGGGLVGWVLGNLLVAGLGMLGTRLYID